VKGNLPVGRPIVLIWDNFGYMHNDRCEALAKHYRGQRSTIGLEIAGKSDIYNWDSVDGIAFKKITLYKGRGIDEISFFSRLYATLIESLRLGPADIFICHYERLATFVVAIMLRVLGRKVYVMNNSKFDDKQRSVFREAVKWLFLRPYCGALVAGARSADYLKFLGVSAESIEAGYNTVSLARVRFWAEATPAPAGVPLSERHFTIIARFVPKKNLSLALDAYLLYLGEVDKPQLLRLVGYGPLEAEIKQRILDLHLEKHVVFEGELSNQATCKLLSTTSVLVLPSLEEQFGNVVIEAQAMGLPVIVSDNCGCWDHLVRNGVNGFVVEPDNAVGLAYFMKLLSTDTQLWCQMCLAAHEFAELGDVKQFAYGVGALLDGGSRYSGIERLHLPGTIK
jgi:L-malate glycosyltransferase